jgi:hypothetical protein
LICINLAGAAAGPYRDDKGSIGRPSSLVRCLQRLDHAPGEPFGDEVVDGVAELSLGASSIACHRVDVVAGNCLLNR